MQLSGVVLSWPVVMCRHHQDGRPPWLVAGQRKHGAAKILAGGARVRTCCGDLIWRSAWDLVRVEAPVCICCQMLHS